MIPFISRLFNIPVTRKEVLKRAKKLKRAGLCFSIEEALRNYGVYTGIFRPCLVKYFPKFSKEEALNFGAEKEDSWWWECSVWNTGRMDFLNWLIDQYKDDKTNLRKIL